MASTNLSRRRWPAAVILALAAIVIGALVGSFHNGSAAIAVKPTNVNAPTVSGTAQVGSTLTATNGTWSGTAPFSFTFQWNRCDKDGKNCSAISGASDNTNAVQN